MNIEHAHIRRIEFANFKALSKFTLSLSDTNILVGPNNSGKSTVIGALRTLDAALRYARTRPPVRIKFDGHFTYGYVIPKDSVPISIENVQTDYNDSDATITFSLNNGNTLALCFSPEGECILAPSGATIRNVADFKREFPVSLIIVPVLGPVEHREERRERSTVVSGLSTHRASRHFRSYWHYNPDGFEAFAALVAKTWPGMQISGPELDHSSNTLSMFCIEERMTRELYWVGFGFQVWCQLLTHLSRAVEGSLFVVDEPEVYLHPDIQRQLLGVIRDSGADVLLATHSSEIIAEADPNEIVMIDKRQHTGERLKNIADTQRAMEAVGSSQNITLTALAKSRRILFIEGTSDYAIIRRLARKLGLQELSSGAGITPLTSGGFGSWERITILAAGISKALGSSLMIGTIYDRDYYCDEQIAFVLETLRNELQFATVLERKEIENYLLIPAALNRAILRAIKIQKETSRKGSPPNINSHEILRRLTESMKDDVISQLAGKRTDFFHKQGIDSVSIYKDILHGFDKRWSDMEARLRLVPGKDVLRKFRQVIQDDFGVTLTDSRIVDAMGRDDIPADMVQMLQELNAFRARTIKLS